MTEKQANEILQKVGKYLFEKVENISAISVVKLGKKEYDLKIIASPTDPTFSFDNNDASDFEKEFKVLRTRISASLQKKSFKLSNENFSEGKLPDTLFQKKELFEFKPIIKFLSPPPSCEFCHKAGSFSIGPIFKIVATPERCFAMLANHTTTDMRLDDTFNVGRLGRIGEAIETLLYERLSPYNQFDLAIGELDFKTFMSKRLSIGQAHYNDSIKHFGCSTGALDGTVVSTNSTVRAYLTGTRQYYVTKRLIELDVNSNDGNSGAPVVGGLRNQILLGLLHSSTLTDRTFCSNLYLANERGLFNGYETTKIYMATT